MRNPETNASRSAPPSAVVHIEKLVHGGFGLGRLEGRVVLVERVLPGETVRVTLTAERGGWAEARPSEWIQTAAGRVEPGCRYFGICGGCRLQHADPALQIELKCAVLRETLRRLGKIEAPQTIAVVSGPAWGYRNRVQLHFEGRRVGFFQSGGRRLCDVEACPIASPKINQALTTLRRMARDPRFPRFLRSLEIFTDEAAVQLHLTSCEGGRGIARRFWQWCAESIPGMVEGALEYAAAGETYRVSPRAFFQVNRFLLEELTRRVVGEQAGQAALDLYAGVGLFSLPLARRFRCVTAVEANPAAAADLRCNAERAGLPIQVVSGSAEQYLQQATDRPEVAVADPPRAGLGPRVTAGLLRLKPRRLILVSCDPATLARDVSALLAGGYRLAEITLVDLFPQTHHIETVATLEL